MLLFVLKMNNDEILNKSFLDRVFKYEKGQKRAFSDNFGHFQNKQDGLRFVKFEEKIYDHI